MGKNRLHVVIRVFPLLINNGGTIQIFKEVNQRRAGNRNFKFPFDIFFRLRLQPHPPRLLCVVSLFTHVGPING